MAPYGSYRPGEYVDPVAEVMRRRAEMGYRDDEVANSALDQMNDRAGQYYDRGSVGARPGDIDLGPVIASQKVGTVVRSPAEVVQAGQAFDPLAERLKTTGSLDVPRGERPELPANLPANDYGLGANLATAANLDEIERAYNIGAGRPDESIDDLKQRLGFKWGPGVELGANGRPVEDSAISAGSGSLNPQLFAQAGFGNESRGGGGVSTVTDPAVVPEYMLEDAKRRIELADPYGVGYRRALAGVDVDKALAIEGGKADITYGQQQRTVNEMSNFERAVDAEVNDNLARLRQRPEYARMSPEQRQLAESKISGAGTAAKEAQRSRYGLASGKATTTFKSDGGFGG